MKFGSAVVLCIAAAAPLQAWAGGPLLIDHKLKYDNAGIWKRDYQVGLADGTAVAVLAGAIFIDGDTRIGQTFEQSLDATAFGEATAAVLKPAFSRARPKQSSDPGDFFKGSGHNSFPSAEVTEISAAVTPFIAEYHDDHPMVWALALLPAWDAEARMKVNGHWQSDVLAGAAIGTAWGIWAHDRPTPVIVSWLPKGVMFGYAKRF